MFSVRSLSRVHKTTYPSHIYFRKSSFSQRLLTLKITNLYAVDSNHNLARLVKEESILAYQMISRPSEKLSKIINKLVKIAQEILLNDREEKYYGCMVKANHTRNQDIVSSIRKIYKLTEEQKIDQQIFNQWTHHVLDDKEGLAFYKMLIFGGIGELSCGAEQWRQNLYSLRTNGPYDPKPRQKRQNVAPSIYYGIYARENSFEAPLKPKEHQKINGIAFWQINEDNSFVKSFRKKGFPLIAGPSGNMGAFLNFAHDAKLEDDEFEAFADYAAAALVNGGHHSFVEAVVASNVFFKNKSISIRKMDGYETLLGKEVLRSYANFIPKMHGAVPPYKKD